MIHAECFRPFIDLVRRLAEFLLSYFTKLCDLLAELLLPSRRVSKRNEISGASMELGQFLALGGHGHLAADLGEDPSKVAEAVDFAVNLLFRGH